MTAAELKTLHDAGHQIGGHTVSHPRLTELSPEEVERELVESRQFLEDLLGSPVDDFASPHGDYNAAVLDQIKRHYRSHRIFDHHPGFGYNRGRVKPYRIEVQGIYDTTTELEVARWIGRAKAMKSWLVLTYHRIDGSDQYATTPSMLARHLDAIVAGGIATATVAQALDELR